MTDDETTRRIRLLRRRITGTRVVGAVVVVGALASLLLPRGGTAVAVVLGVVALAAIVGVGVPSMLRLRTLLRRHDEVAA
jgi:uncharacterized membrane protein